jgi:hypothetical protein
MKGTIVQNHEQSSCLMLDLFNRSRWSVGCIIGTIAKLLDY